MRKILALFVAFLMVAGCSDKPSAGKIEDLFTAQLHQMQLDKVMAVSNFTKTNGILNPDHSYTADVTYDIMFKVAADDINDKFGPAVLGASLPFVVRSGNFKAGDTRHLDGKLTLVKSDNGWIIQGQ